MLSTGRSCDGRRLRMPCVHCSCQTKTISAFFFEFHSPHHKDWRLGSQQVRQNCIGFHGRCKTQRGHLRRKPKICTANPGSSLHLTTTSRNSSCSLSLSLSCIQHNHIVCVARLIIGLFTCALGWRRKANNPKQSYMYYNNV